MAVAAAKVAAVAKAVVVAKAVAKAVVVAKAEEVAVAEVVPRVVAAVAIGRARPATYRAVVEETILRQGRPKKA